MLRYSTTPALPLAFNFDSNFMNVLNICQTVESEQYMEIVYIY